MSKKISRSKLLIGLSIVGLFGIGFLGFRGFQETQTTAPAPTPLPKNAPFNPGRAIQSPNVVDKPVVGQIVVKFKSQYTDDQIATQLKKYKASVSREISEIGQTVVKVPAGQEDAVVRQLQSDGYVDAAQRDYTTHALYSPNDQGFASQWGLDNTGQVIQGTRGIASNDIRATTAWNVSLGSGIKVAILDTGINLNHPDLAGKVIAQRSYVSSSVEDNNGHGTHIAGIIAANTNNSIGVAGVCPGCQLIIAKVMDDQGNGTTSNTIAAIVWAVDQGARVINLSLGSTIPATEPLYQQAIAYANQRGAVIVAAAGNGNTSAKLYPAANPGVISVTATDNKNQKASFASYGSWVQLAAPGTNILSTMPTHTNQKGVLNYGYDSGTSMAGPFVAGVAALVAGTNYGTSAQAIQSRLYATANKITGTGTYWSQGFINATSAVGVNADSSEPQFACVGGAGAPPCAQIPDVVDQAAFDALPNNNNVVTPVPASAVGGAPTTGNLPSWANLSSPLARDSFTTTTPCTNNYTQSGTPLPNQGSFQPQFSGNFFEQLFQFFLQLLNMMFKVGNVATPCTTDPQPVIMLVSPTPGYEPIPTGSPIYNGATPIYKSPTTVVPTAPYAIGTPVYENPKPPYYPATPTLFTGYGPTPTPTTKPTKPTPSTGSGPTATPTPSTPSSNEIIIFNDDLGTGWSDASFDATQEIVTENVHSGTRAIATTIKANGGLDFQSVSGVFTNAGGQIEFALRASAANQAYEVYADTMFGQPLADPVSLANYGGQPTTTAWKVYRIPLADLKAVNVNLRDIVIHDATGADQPVLYVDSVKLLAVSTQNPTPTVEVVTPAITTTPQPEITPTGTASATTTPTLTTTLTPTTGLTTTPTPTAITSITPTLGTLTPTVRPPTTTPTLTPTNRPPTVTPTTRPTATPTPSPTPTPSLIVRRSIYSLSSAEVQRLTSAINTMRTRGIYQNFLNRHAQAMSTLTPANDPTTFRNVAHRGPAFFPWHRGMLWEFEQELRKIDPSVSLPYWPFEQDASRASAGQIPQILTAAYFGSDGNRSQNNRVTDGPFASWNITRMVGRDPQGLPTLPSQADVNSVLQYTNYDSPPYNETSSGFRNAVEGWIGSNGQVSMHNRVHLYVGGSLGGNTNDNVALDPIFFLLHANVDRLWWQWQQMRGQNNYQPTSGGPAGHNLNDVMQILPERFTPANTLSTQSMGYTYQ